MKTYTRDELFAEIVKLMAELFEVEPADVTMDSKLVEDLDLDSIDAVDMIVHLQNFTGLRIKPEEFKAVRTVGDVIDVLEKLMNEHAE